LRRLEGLREKIGTLSECPDRCPLALKSKSLPFEMRQLLYGRKPRIYRILSTIRRGASLLHLSDIAAIYSNLDSMTLRRLSVPISAKLPTTGLRGRVAEKRVVSGMIFDLEGCTHASLTSSFLLMNTRAL